MDFLYDIYYVGSCIWITVKDNWEHCIISRCFVSINNDKLINIGWNLVHKLNGLRSTSTLSIMLYDFFSPFTCYWILCQTIGQPKNCEQSWIWKKKEGKKTHIMTLFVKCLMRNFWSCFNILPVFFPFNNCLWHLLLQTINGANSLLYVLSSHALEALSSVNIFARTSSLGKN